MKRIAKRLSCFAMALLLIIGLCAYLPLQTAEASGPADSLTIRAGYYGYPYVVKAVMSPGEVESLGTYDCLYTAIDRANRLNYSEAYGVSFYNFLTYVGVDPGKIQKFNFRTMDTRGESTDYYYSQILGGGRYAFPAASNYYERGVGYSDIDAVWASAESVSTMLALTEMRTRINEDYSDYVPDGNVRTDVRFRLMIGQENPSQLTASESLYGVREMIITYYGEPSISANDVEFKVGENQMLEATVSSEESELNDIIKAGLQYKSSNEKVVKVDSTGKLTAVGKGEAEITVYYTYDEEGDGVSAVYIEKTVKIVVGEGDSGSGGSGGTGGGTGDGDGSGSGGTGGGHGTGDGDGGDGGGTGGNTGTGGGGTTGGGTGTGGDKNQPGDGDGGKKEPTGDNNKPNENPDNNKPNQNNQNNDESKPEQEKPRNEQNNTNNTNNTNRNNQTEQPEDNQTVYVTPEKSGDIKKTPDSGRTITVKRLTAVNGSSGTGGGSAPPGEGGSAGGTPGGSAALALAIQSPWVMLIVMISALALLIIGGAGMFIRYRKEI